MIINIANKEYDVKEAKTDKLKVQGLQGVKELPENEGMLFYFDPPEDVSFHMYNTHIPLDIIFIDEDLEVISVAKGTPEDRKLIEEDDVAYVLEVNQNSGIKPGDYLDFNELLPVMKVLFLDGTTLMELYSGERIVSRRETKILIKKAKKANESKSDNDYKSLGRYMFKVLKGLDTRPAEYTLTPD